MICPFCESAAPEWARDDRGPGKAYFRCPSCDLLFLDPARRRTAAEEKARYLLHSNGGADRGYLEYMARIADSGLLPFIAPGEAILDFGCGPYPALENILVPRGYRVASWDPLFQPDGEPLGRKWNAIACIEVAEHFRDPAASFGLLASLLAPDGVLCLRSLAPPARPADFLAWWYRQDATHIAFYSEACLASIRGELGLGEVFSDGKGLRAWRRSPAA